MTRDEIIRLARDGARWGDAAYSFADALERFAELIASAEREACAQIADGFPENRDWVPGSLLGNIRREVASAIRSRKDRA